MSLAVSFHLAVESHPVLLKLYVVYSQWEIMRSKTGCAGTCRELVITTWLTYNPSRSMPILDERTLEFLSHSPEQTRRLGVRLGELIQSGDLLCLSGDLGSGKTTLAQGIARGWGSLDPVTSPTFILINEYHRADAKKLYHFDAFRLSGVVEAVALGLYDLLDGAGPVLIEWPERIEESLPDERLWISLRWVDEMRRGLHFEAQGIQYERMLQAFRQTTFGG